MKNQSTYLFPGMDPWLEYPSIWGDVHFRLISAIAGYLSPLLTPQYYVAVGTHTYISTADGDVSARIPDVTVVEKSPGIVSTTAAAGQVDAPILVEVPLSTVIEEAYLEIREPISGDVITAIELLSPYNKRPGAGRDKYVQKRLEIFATQTHLIEIDLLRNWPPMPVEGDVDLQDYRILVRRGEEGSKARLYPFSVRDTIPRFPIPLQAGDDEPIADLGQLLRQIYDEAYYPLRLDYGKPPVPPLDEKDREWAEKLLQASKSEAG